MPKMFVKLFWVVGFLKLKGFNRFLSSFINLLKISSYFLKKFKNGNFCLYSKVNERVENLTIRKNVLMPSTFTTSVVQLGCLSIYLVSFRLPVFQSEKEAKDWILFPRENVCSVTKNENRWHCKASGRSTALPLQLLGKVRDTHKATNCCSNLYDLIKKVTR